MVSLTIICCPLVWSLTYFPSSKFNTLLRLKRPHASTGIVILDEAVSTLHGDLSKTAVLVENIENVALGNFLGKEVA